MNEAVIKRGNIEIKLNRSDLIEVHETNDGISFNCKYGIHIYITDPEMPNGTKNIIRNTAQSFEGKKLNFDLNNYITPVSVDAM